jgi:threonine synthase
MAEENGWFNLSTFKEPYRVEGKKTMGLELAEQFGWQPPDVILYPTGGGTGLVGMWKAFLELRELGWTEGDLPRMVCVQSEGCAPLVSALTEGKERAEPWDIPKTYATGIRVPSAFADRLILRAVRESKGWGVAVGEDEIRDAQKLLAQEEGILACPEGAATLPALMHLRQDGRIGREDRVVLFNTGTGLKYLL